MVLRKMLSLQSDPISSEELVVESDIMVWPSVIAHQITDGVSSLCSSVKVLLQGKNIQWKNPPAKPNEAYQPTLVEQTANIFSHGICVLPAMYATWLLTQQAASPTQFWAGLVYGVALVLLFTVSTAFHTTCLCHKNRMKDVLHRGDRAMIYIFIASSYFPWLSLAHKVQLPAVMNMKSSTSLLSTLLSWLGVDSILVADLRWTVWFLAAMGILYQHIFHEKYKWLETLIYVATGLLPSLPFIHGNEFPGMWELKLGGACYIIGLVFFKLDGRLPLAHAIWHLHVAMGASIHYYGVFTHLMG